MKKIINGKLYNTDTAKALGSYDNGLGGGEKIFPQTEAEAKKWVEDHLDADTYIEIFGEVEE